MLYVLSLKIGSAWQQVAVYEATDNIDALGRAMSRIPREHYDKPMELRPQTDAAAEAISINDPRR